MKTLNDSCDPFVRNNIIKESFFERLFDVHQRKVRTLEIIGPNLRSSGKYRAYFHLYATLEDAWYNKNKWNKVIMCEVPKKEITEIGTQSGTVIVTKQFFILKEDEYLEEE